MSSSYTSLLPVVRTCNNIILPHLKTDKPIYALSKVGQSTLDKEPLRYLYVRPDDCLPVGLVRPVILDLLRRDNEERKAQSEKPCFSFIPNDESVDIIAFEEWLVESQDTSSPLITEQLDRLLVKWRTERHFAEILDGWRNEHYSIYRQKTNTVHPAFSVERSGALLFGFATFGSHLTAYYEDSKDNKVRIWIPRRSRTKPTYPGMLDNSVAGGIATGELPLDCIVRECAEEASLSEEIVRKHIRATGTISYNLREARGFIQPTIQYIYDLHLPQSVELQPMDGEAESFEAMTIEQTIKELHAGSFKPNSGLITVDWLVRHGFVTAENDSEYLSIVSEMHSSLTFPVSVWKEKK